MWGAKGIVACRSRQVEDLSSGYFVTTGNKEDGNDTHLDTFEHDFFDWGYCRSISRIESTVMQLSCWLKKWA